MADFAKVFKQLRTDRELSQSALAEKLGISKSAVNMYERGERRPDFETVEAIADFFHVNMNYLLGFTDKISRPSGDQTDDKVYNKYLATTLEEIELINAYRHAGTETQAAIRAILHL